MARHTCDCAGSSKMQLINIVRKYPCFIIFVKNEKLLPIYPLPLLLYPEVFPVFIINNTPSDNYMSIYDILLILSKYIEKSNHFVE